MKYFFQADVSSKKRTNKFDFTKSELQPGAVQLCCLKIGNFLPPPTLLIVFLLSKISNFWKSKNLRPHSRTFKTDIMKMVLVFLTSNFFTIKNSLGRKLIVVELQQFSFTCQFVFFHFLVESEDTKKTF